MREWEGGDGGVKKAFCLLSFPSTVTGILYSTTQSYTYFITIRPASGGQDLSNAIVTKPVSRKSILYYYLSLTHVHTHACSRSLSLSLPPPPILSHSMFLHAYNRNNRYMYMYSLPKANAAISF